MWQDTIGELAQEGAEAADYNALYYDEEQGKAKKKSKEVSDRNRAGTAALSSLPEVWDVVRLSRRRSVPGKGPQSNLNRRRCHRFLDQKVDDPRQCRRFLHDGHAVLGKQRSNVINGDGVDKSCKVLTS